MRKNSNNPLFTFITSGFLLMLLLFNACKGPTPVERKRGLIAEKAMVVSAHPLASEVGAKILEKGGNAVDAAIAVQFALAVVYPVAGNIGGGGFMVVRQKDGSAYALDFREKAPAAADRDMYLDEEGNAVSDMSRLGHLAAGVPGSVAGMFAAHDSLGRLPMNELIQPSIDLAMGYKLTEKEAASYTRAREQIEEYSTQPTFFSQKEEWAAGDKIVNEALAHTLTLIRDHGVAGFYEGETADKIVAEMERGGGIMTHDDLKNYQAVWRDAIIGNYKDYRIISMAPPSSGGIALMQLLNMVGQHPDALAEGFHSVASTHLIVEAERRVYADRAKHLGDMDFYPVPIDGLLDPAYLQARMSDFGPNQATDSDVILAGEPLLAEHDETTHFSIIDAEGNAVSLTTTINGGYGNKVVVGGAGFLLNNEMDDFSAKPGVPNMFGLIGAEANAIEPGKRMLSSMTPSIVEKNGNLFMVVGTPGGSTIITSVFQTILNVIEYNMYMQEAVAAPRFHHQWKPDMIMLEKNAFDKGVQQALEEIGHTFSENTRNIGRVDAILVLPDGKLEGGADPRGDDSAAGF